MKKLMFVLATLFLFQACQKKEECCVVVEASVDISVVEKATGKDLLDPKAEKHFDVKDIMLEFSTNPAQKMHINAIQISQPLLFENNGKHYLRIFPTTSEALKDEHSVKVYWSESDIDEVKFQLKHQKQNVFTDRIYVNDNIMWQNTDGNRAITIMK